MPVAPPVTAVAKDVERPRAGAKVPPEDADVVVLGMLPPPVTGASKNTQLMVDEVVGQGVRTAALSTSVGASALERSAAYHLKRGLHFLHTSAALRRGGANRPHDPTLYMVPDGGSGIIYSAAYLKLARRRYAHVLLHHRTFLYIDRPNRWMRAICSDLVGKITHVFLSDGMRQRFQASYGEQPSLIVGNARYVRPLTGTKSSDTLVLGHLSNLSAAKGFDEAASTFEALRTVGLPVKLVLAGPVADQATRSALERLLARHPDAVEYLGPTYGEAKDEFYRRIHLFLFPTRWPQEAQPNVVYEAFAGGAAVVAYGRGSIPEMVPANLGLVIPPEADFVAEAVPYIRAFWECREAAPTLTHFHAEVEDQARIAQAQHERLLATLVRTV